MKHEIRNVLEMTWPTLVIVVSIVVVLRLTYVFRGERKRFVLHEEIFDLLFLVYLIILWQLVTGQDLNVNGGTNFMPFREILRYDYGTLSFYKQVFGNILLFIPLGYFATSYCRILNVVGGIIGFLLYKGLSSIKKHLPDFLQKDWIYNILSVLFVGLIIFYLIKIL